MRRSLVPATLGLIVAAGLAVPALTTSTSAAAAFSCQGKTATHVGSPGKKVTGTSGDDVIVSAGASSVTAGGGDDLICVTGKALLTLDVITVDAGPGDDDVSATPVRHQPDAFMRVDLGTGADYYRGWAYRDEVTDQDTDADVIRTAGGRDSVYVGVEGEPMLDQVNLGVEPPRDVLPIGYEYLMGGLSGTPVGGVSVAASSMGPGASLEVVDGPAPLLIPAATSGTWDIDNSAATGTAVDGGVERFRFTGFNEFRVGSNLNFTGGADGEVAGAGSPQSPRVLQADMGGGDDIAIVLNPTEDDVVGGPGSDRLVLLSYTENAERQADPQAGTITLATTAPSATLDGDPVTFSGFERYVLNAYRSVTAVGSAGPDDITATSCDTNVSTGDGTDRIETAYAYWKYYDDDAYCDEEALVDGGRLGDVIIAGGPRTVARGGTGPDRITITELGGTAYGEEGDDVIHGLDVSWAGFGDRLYGGPGNDYIDGEAGDDVIYGNAGNDRLYGDSGRDTVYGSTGNDLCRAEVRKGCER